MTLRRQGSGGQSPWKLEEIREGFQKYFELHATYPTAQEIDAFEFLPSSRSIQRTFGGLISVRKQLNISGQHNFTKGERGIKRGHEVHKRKEKLREEVHKFLIKTFGKKHVQKNFLLRDDARSKIDFYVSHKNGEFVVDTFYSKDAQTLIGSLNSKLKSYSTVSVSHKILIFVQGNREIKEDTLKDMLSRKKNTLNDNQFLMSRETFEKFCLNKDSLKDCNNNFRKNLE